MSEPVLTYKSLFDYDSHVHIFLTDNGERVLRIELDQISDGRDGGITAEATVTFLFGNSDAKPFMRYERMNLLNSGQAGWGKILKEADEYGSFNWKRDITPAIHDSIEQHRTAAQAWATLERGDPDTAEVPFILPPLVSSTGLTLLYSAPGVGKSMLALATAVSVATGTNVLGTMPTRVGPVVYVDFEDDASVHSLRLNAILNSIEWDDDKPVPIIHFTVYGKFKDAIGPIRRVIRENKAVMVIVDSMGGARGTDPSDGDSTIKLTKGIRSFGVPTLAIDHVTKADNKDMKDGKTRNVMSVMAIGSQFSTAGARLGWFVEEVSSSKPMEKHWNLHNPKQNHVAVQSSFSMLMKLTNNDRGLLTDITFEPFGDTVFEEFTVDSMEGMILKWFYHNEVSSATTTEIAKGMSSTPTTVNSALRNEKYFEKMPKVGRNVPYKLTAEGRSESERLISGPKV